MSRTTGQRYGDVAVIFHWLIAFFIIGLLAIGKYMTGLEENDPVRFVLTQWHKSFGLTVLALSILRLLWRFTHRPPAPLVTTPQWQERAASAAHILLYVFMLGIPITGWIMVSASPLNIDTVLFNVITIPHLPPFPELANKAEIEHQFRDYHELLGNALIIVLLIHIGAALKHHWKDKDTTLVRMSPKWSSSAFKAKIAALAVAIVGSTAALYIYASSGNQAAILAAGASEVSFIADVTGSQTPGIFAESEVTASIDESNAANSSMVAIVNTASLSSENSQVEGSLPDSEWFDVEGYPEARFESTQITSNDDGSLQIQGELTIKETTMPVDFAMTLEEEGTKQVARGEFIIDRRDFDIGMQSQSNEEYVGFKVTVRFRFDIGEDIGQSEP